jgi:hypothetical protein
MDTSAPGVPGQKEGLPGFFKGGIDYRRCRRVAREEAGMPQYPRRSAPYTTGGGKRRSCALYRRLLSSQAKKLILYMEIPSLELPVRKALYVRRLLTIGPELSVPT